MARTGITTDQRVRALEQRVRVLESGRPGRKPKPLLAVREYDVCALDPTRDSKTCPDASIYRYQNGCHGARCRLKQHEAYERRKVNRASATKVRVRRKTTAPAKKSAPKTEAPRKLTTAKSVVKQPTKRVSKRLAS